MENQTGGGWRSFSLVLRFVRRILNLLGHQFFGDIYLFIVCCLKTPYLINQTSDLHSINLHPCIPYDQQNKTRPILDTCFNDNVSSQLYIACISLYQLLTALHVTCQHLYYIMIIINDFVQSTTSGDPILVNSYVLYIRCCFYMLLATIVAKLYMLFVTLVASSTSYLVRQLLVALNVTCYISYYQFYILLDTTVASRSTYYLLA